MLSLPFHQLRHNLGRNSNLYFSCKKIQCCCNWTYALQSKLHVVSYIYYYTIKWEAFSKVNTLFMQNFAMEKIEKQRVPR